MSASDTLMSKRPTPKFSAMFDGKFWKFLFIGARSFVSSISDPFGIPKWGAITGGRTGQRRGAKNHIECAVSKDRKMVGQKNPFCKPDSVQRIYLFAKRKWECVVIVACRLLPPPRQARGKFCSYRKP
jgi:hypothetical protein